MMDDRDGWQEISSNSELTQDLMKKIIIYIYIYIYIYVCVCVCVCVYVCMRLHV